ncbi:hypothetical protein ACA910_007781 [Epithemia clementina (nom. ined.)]
MSASEQSSIIKKNELAREFCLNLETSLREGTFRSFTLFGPSSKKSSNKKKPSSTASNHQDNHEELRGCFKRIIGRNVEIQRKKAVLVQVTFKYHLATDAVKNWQASDAAKGVHSLFLLESIGTGEEKENRIVAEPEQAVSEWGTRVYPIGTKFGIQRAVLETNNTTWELDVAYSSSRPRLKSKLASTITTTSTSAAMEPLSLAHDRIKDVPVASSSDFLQALGVTNAEGKPRPGKASKLRQIQKFVEIVSGLVEKATSSDGDINDNNSNGADSSVEEIMVVDAGCGRGYLTFALHSLLHENYGGSKMISSRGIDIRPKLVEEINTIARSLGQSFDGLVFETGTIESFMSESVTKQTLLSSAELKSRPKDERQPKTMEVVIALHACDTATDDALWAGICRQAAVICVAPCCHKELRPQIDMHYHSASVSQNKGNENHPLGDVLRYGIYRERMTETVTDAMRALLLELMGYDVNVFEFIGGEHTSKNVMITAVRKPFGTTPHAAKLQKLRTRLQLLSSFHGVSYQKLAILMGEDVLAGAEENSSCSQVSSLNMPPLL